MDYNKALNWLFSQLPAYQKIGKKAYKADLTNINKLSDYLGNPHTQFKSVHVGGTNGKGSSSHMLASILQEAGYKVGLYTSPHLKDFRERIKINGTMISENFVHNFILKHKSFFKENSLSFFEMTVGMGFDFFASQKVDIAIIEVGLGGRLDATNIILPEVSLITNIGLDHVSFLGDNIKDIAFEKAGIIKENTPVVISETQNEIKQVFIDKAISLNSEISFADHIVPFNFKTDLLGNYQQKNAKGVSLVIDKLKSFKVTNLQKLNGFKNIVANTGLQGRWQILQHKPKVICDTAHNKEGLSLTINQLLSEQFDELRIVFGVVADKDISSILSLLPKKAHYYFCAPNISRALPVDNLVTLASEFGLFGAKFNSVNEAFSAAKSHSLDDDLIYVGGSTFIVSEII